MAKKPSPKTYRSLSAELGQIVEWFESGEADIDEALDKYNQALKLIAELEAYLKTAENKITKIKSGE